jgi:uncharacterized protein
MTQKNSIRKNILINGMTCTSCEKIIGKQALSLDGVENIHIDYTTGKGHVTFDPSKTDIDEILDKIEEKGYEGRVIEKDKHPEKKEDKDSFTFNLKWLWWFFIIIGIGVIGYFLFRFAEGVNLPQISPTMSYGLLFVVGLLTGFHCVAMCGGFVVSYTAKNAQEGKSSHKSHLAYGSGKLISYTVIGAIFGLIGSIIIFTPLIRGVAGIIAGLFLILFGINMLFVIPFLRKIRIRTPRFLSKFVGEKNKNASPFIIGLLNGLMIACGPLQAIYIMAASTGSMIEGAKLLFIFALGTLPVMLGFGYLTSFISSKMANKILKVSGVVVLILGLIMINRGLALTGSGYDINSLLSSSTSSTNVAKGVDIKTDNLNTKVNANVNSNTNSNVILVDGYQEIRMDVLASGWSPNKFVLKKGVPVKWIINGKEITNCNKAIQVPKLGLKFDVKPGLQTIEFTPTEAGTIPFSCWMGMIQGTFIVTDNVDVTNKEAVQTELNAVQTPTGGSCNMGSNGGSCGCGG